MKDGAGNVRQLGVPVGAIMAYLPGYFANGSNGTYTAVSMTLPDGYVLCEGTAPNDALSPIWNSPTRYVPNISDARFLSGNTVANRGVIGGVNTIPAHSGSTFADHTHTISDHTNLTHNITGYPDYIVPYHSHQWAYSEDLSRHTRSWDSGNTVRYISGLPAGNTNPRLQIAGDQYYMVLSSDAPPTWPTNDVSTVFYTNRYPATTCNMTGSLGISTHVISAHSVTSSGSGAVTIVNDHAAGSNMPVYINCSYIIKIK
jgi:hypothetical protein